MNQQLLDILEQRDDYTLAAADRKIVRWFVEYLDHNSLWLLGFEPASGPLFTFTNEAQRYKFTLDEIKAYYVGMKSGTAMDWETVPFEYITK